MIGNGVRRTATCWIGFAALTYAIGCGPPSASPPEASNPSTLEEVAQAPTREVQIPPMSGELSVAIEGDRVSVRAGGVPRLRVLEAIAEAGEFELQGSCGRDRVTLRHVDAPLSEVLAELLSGHAFHAEWAVADPGGRSSHRLMTLRLITASSDGPLAGEPALQGDAALEAETLTPEQEEELRRAREAPPPPPGTPPKDQDTLLGQLQSRDPEDRMEALVEMNSRGFGTDEIIAALDDPDPEVRITALERLAEDDTFVGTAAIVDALHSEDADVVIRSVDLLVNTGDPSLVGAIAPLLFHPDVAVRLAAEEALVDLDDSPLDLPERPDLPPNE